jgi:hypothetical protein
MTLSITERYENISATTFGTGAFTSGSFTPTANSLLLVGVCGVSNNNGPVSSIQLTNTGSLNFQQASPGPNLQENGTTFNVTTTWFVAEVGGSPASMTVSVQGSKTNLVAMDMFVWGLWIADLTNYNTTVQIGTQARSGSRTDPNALSITTLSTPRSTSGIFGLYGAMYGGDGAGAISPGADFTEAWEAQNTDFAFHVQYDLGAGDNTVEWVDVTGGTGTFLGYAASVIEVYETAETTLNTHHPRLASWARTVTENNSSLSCNLPAGIATGDLILSFVATDNIDASASGYTEIFDTANAAAVRGFVLARIATGSDALTITNAGAQDIAVLTCCIKDHGVTDPAAITQGTATTNSTATPDPPNCNPGVADEWLYLGFFFADDDDNAGTWVANVAGLTTEDMVAQVESAATASSVMVGLEMATSVATSYNPAAFTLAASEEWVTGSMAIPPEVVGGAPPPELRARWTRGRPGPWLR